MKKILFTCLLIASIATVYSQKNRTISSNSNTTNGKNQHTIRISDDDTFLEIKYDGEIAFNDDETAIKSLSPNSSFSYNKDGKKIKVTSDENGTISYEVNGGAKKSTLDTEEAAFLASAIKTMIEHGVGAKDRVARIYKKSGSRAVLDEVGKLKTDHVKTIYLEYLLETAALSAKEMTEIANNVKEAIKSDYEKGKLLGKFSEKYLADPATAAAYIGAVKSITSDYEKGKAIKVILAKELSAAQSKEILQVIKSIKSDYEKAGVLKQVLNKNKISDTQFSELLQVTASINSDYEKSNVLKSLIKNNKLSEAHFNEVLQVAATINSGYEKANVLSLLADEEIASESNWISLISAVEKTSSDYEKSKALINIAGKMPKSENVKTAYTKTAKTISSDYEYGKVLRAIEK